jgi:hypothetical protein
MRKLHRWAHAASFMLVWALSAPASGQEVSRYQLEFALDRTGGAYMYGISLTYPDGAEDMMQVEQVNFSIAGSRLVGLPAGFSGRFGLGVGNKGYREEIAINTAASGGPSESSRSIRLIYAGAPFALGYNLLGRRSGIHPFAEAGVSVDVLLHQTDSHYRDFDLRRAGLSYLGSAGLRYTRADGRSLILAPELRVGAMNYDSQDDFRPVALSLRLGVQF